MPNGAQGLHKADAGRCELGKARAGVRPVQAGCPRLPGRPRLPKAARMPKDVGGRPSLPVRYGWHARYYLSPKPCYRIATAATRLPQGCTRLHKGQTRAVSLKSTGSLPVKAPAFYVRPANWDATRAYKGRSGRIRASWPTGELAGRRSPQAPGTLASCKAPRGGNLALGKRKNCPHYSVPIFESSIRP